MSEPLRVRIRFEYEEFDAPMLAFHAPYRTVLIGRYGKTLSATWAFGILRLHENGRAVVGARPICVGEPFTGDRAKVYVDDFIGHLARAAAGFGVDVVFEADEPASPEASA